MASNITGQLLGLISAGSAFMGSARREAAMSEKRYETKEAATKAAEQKQITAEQKAKDKEVKAKEKEAQKAKDSEARINEYKQKQEIKKQAIIETRKESGLTANAEALASKREADAELTKQKSKLVQEQTRGEKSKRMGTYGEGGALSKSKKAKIQEIAEADAVYQAQQSQEQHTNQKNVVQQLITEAKNVK